MPILQKNEARPSKRRGSRGFIVFSCSTRDVDAREFKEVAMPGNGKGGTGKVTMISKVVERAFAGGGQWNCRIGTTLPKRFGEKQGNSARRKGKRIKQRREREKYRAIAIRNNEHSVGIGGNSGKKGETLN